MESTQQLVTEIFVRDIHASVQFYRRLGFEVFRENGTFAVLTWENHRLFLDQRDDLPPPPVFPQANMYGQDQDGEVKQRRRNWLKVT